MDETYEFELAFDEETGHPKLNEEEMIRFIEAKTGLTREQIIDVTNAEMEYMEACGLVLTEEEDGSISASVEAGE